MQYRALNRIDCEDFRRHIAELGRISDREAMDHKVQHYHSILRATLDTLAPLKCRCVPV